MEDKMCTYILLYRCKDETEYHNTCVSENIFQIQKHIFCAHMPAWHREYNWCQSSPHSTPWCQIPANAFSKIQCIFAQDEVFRPAQTNNNELFSGSADHPLKSNYFHTPLSNTSPPKSTRHTIPCIKGKLSFYLCS